MEKDIGQKDDTESLALTEYKKNNFFKRLLDFFNKNKLKKFDYTEHKDTAVFPFGQVLIEYDGKKIDYHKVQKNKSITDLSNEELSYIKKLRKIDSRYIYNAEDIRRIVAHNPNIDEHGDYVEILSLVEKIIPKGCDRNFYRNIKDLKIQLDMEDTLENTKRDKTLVAGAYDIKENEIIIPKEFIELIFNGSTSNKDFSTKIKLVLLHELFHMASSEYDKEKDIVNCGFYVYPTRNMEQQNVGLTEGMTEMCVSLITGVSNSNNSTYSVGELFCKQLCLLVGLDTMLESYFNNLGIENIKKISGPAQKSL